MPHILSLDIGMPQPLTFSIPDRKSQLITNAQNLPRFKSRVRHFSCWTLQHRKSPADWARERFEHGL